MLGKRCAIRRTQEAAKEPLNGRGAWHGAQLVSEQPLSEGERWRLGLGGMVQ